MSKPLSNESILAMLAEDANKPKRGGGQKVDLTLDRTIPTWYKLNHHLCSDTCEHRQAEGNIKHRACWNPECVDPRAEDDGGINIVTDVHGQWLCRYCFLAGYLLPTQLGV